MIEPASDGLPPFHRVLAADARVTALDHTALRASDVAALWSRPHSERQVVVLDVCMDPPADAAEFAREPEASEERFHRRLFATPRFAKPLTVLAGVHPSRACTSAFAQALAKGLEGAADTNGDQTITTRELYDYVRRAAPSTALDGPDTDVVDLD
jgi:hypothetical protein